jgi:hypothetical protein
MEIICLIPNAGGGRRQGGKKRKVGDDLHSQAATRPVLSALAGLTTGFEMGPGVPPPLQTPTIDFSSLPPSAPPAEYTEVKLHATKRFQDEGVKYLVILSLRQSANFSVSHIRR